MQTTGIPLRVRLSIGSTARLSVAIAAFATIAYQTTKRATLEAVEARARAASYSLAQRSSLGLRDVLRPLVDAARDPAIIAALRSQVVSPEAQNVLARLPHDTTQTVATGLRLASGEVILALDAALPTWAFDESQRLDTAGFGRTFSRADSVLYEAVAPVVDGGQLLGSLVRVRRLASSPATLQSVSSLIGEDGVLLFGNRDGSLWTDLARPVEGPPSLEATKYRKDGSVRLIATRVIANTPWVFGVEFPEARVLAPVHRLLWEFTAIGAAIVGLGFIAGWWANSRVTKPLTELSNAAERISERISPDSPKAVPRTDELGRLQHAFQVMVERVQRSRDELERKVQDRTRALEQAQSALIRKERLAVLGQLAASVGHEIRNPLGVMRNVVFYLGGSLRDVSPKVKDHLATLDKQIGLTEKIVADILDFTRVKAPDRTEVLAAEFLDEQIRRVGLPSGVRIEREVEDDLPPMHADPAQIGQIVLNLLTNAVQAIDGRGGVITVRCRADEGRVRLEIEDDGPGVAEENLERIFEPLFTTKSRGFGLGLSVSRSLAQANGGDLRASRAPGGGALFTLALPAAVPV